MIWWLIAITIQRNVEGNRNTDFYLNPYTNNKGKILKFIWHFPPLSDVTTGNCFVYILHIMKLHISSIVILTLINLLINIETFHDIPSQSSDNLQCIDPRLINISAWSQRRHLIITAPKKGSTSHLLYIFALLTSNASDCHPNLGPITRRSVKYPSEICGKACKWSRTIRSIACTRLWKMVSH
jgi:hypothetical protein